MTRYDALEVHVEVAGETSSKIESGPSRASSHAARTNRTV